MRPHPVSDNSSATVVVDVLPVRQKATTFYVGVMKALDLNAMAEADRLRLENLKLAKYAGFQRALVESRVDEIRDYLATPKATFPNAIIVSLDSRFIDEWDDVNAQTLTQLKIKREAAALTIIDGQHRVAAFNNVDTTFTVSVTIFIDLDIIRCAEIFAKINSTQKAVNPSIAFQLFGYSENRSPQKTAHQIAEVLTTKEGSPFYRMLRMLGTKDDFANGSLSQATFAKELMTLYSRSPRTDENALLRDETLDVYDGYPLRSFFANAHDAEILTIIWRFFAAIAKTWPTDWQGDNGSILPKTTGYAAFIRVLREWLRRHGPASITKGAALTDALAGIGPQFNGTFTRLNYPAGNQGVTLLRDALLSALELSDATAAS
jgi:DGQHR domain-containing protein